MLQFVEKNYNYDTILKYSTSCVSKIRLIVQCNEVGPNSLKQSVNNFNIYGKTNIVIIFSYGMILVPSEKAMTLSLWMRLPDWSRKRSGR